jgi:hypothetical protein
MAPGIQFIRFHQFYEKLVYKIGEYLKVRGEIVYRHVPEYPVLAGDIAPGYSVTQAGQQFPAYHGHEMGRRHDLPVQFIKVNALTRPSGKIFN